MIHSFVNSSIQQSGESNCLLPNKSINNKVRGVFPNKHHRADMSATVVTSTPKQSKQKTMLYTKIVTIIKLYSQPTAPPSPQAQEY